jgi:hypothetical protein
MIEQTTHADHVYGGKIEIPSNMNSDDRNELDLLLGTRCEQKASAL